MPAVSIIIPSYNHERFIEECIQSVLNQTFQDFEIIITDDASTDHTVDIIEQFQDPRIRIFRHFKNKGASVTANHCITQSSGKYIAMLSSDDAWRPNKLETQVDYLEKHPEIGAVFGKVDWVDEAGRHLLSSRLPYMDAFNVSNRDRFEWLRHFFYRGNCLCHPCSLVRRECYDEIGLLNPTFANLPDFDFWIRLCLRYDIHILDQKLTRFRKMQNETNASGDTTTSRVRNRFEHFQILNHFLQLKNPNEFLRVFPESARYGQVTPSTIPFILGQMAIEKGSDFSVLWGLNLIYNELQNPTTAKMLEQEFNFTYRDFIVISGKCDPFKVSDFFPLLPPSQVLQKNTLQMFLQASKDYARAIKLIIARLLT